LAIAKKNPGLVAVFEKCLEMELWNIEASAQSEVNKTMEDLTLISRRGEREIVNNLVHNFLIIKSNLNVTSPVGLRLLVLINY